MPHWRSVFHSSASFPAYRGLFLARLCYSRFSYSNVIFSFPLC
jgi:hypothetical protein